LSQETALAVFSKSTVFPGGNDDCGQSDNKKY